MNIFGVRHLSPGASQHLIRYLDEIKPKCVLIDGPSDANDLIPHLADKRVKPTIALLAYTTEMPVETVLYPFAEYSPELQAIRWGVQHKATVRFIDLPCSTILKVKQKKEKNEAADEFYAFHNGLYARIAKQDGEDDYERYWERNFEHQTNDLSFREGHELQSAQMREMVV